MFATGATTRRRRRPRHPKVGPGRDGAARRVLKSRERARAGLRREQALLLFERVDEDVLRDAAAGGGVVQRRRVPVTTPHHLAHQEFVAGLERSRLADPALRLGVPRVTPRATVNYQDVPQPVELAMLPEEVLSTELSRWHFPDSHPDILIVAPNRRAARSRDDALSAFLLSRSGLNGPTRARWPRLTRRDGGRLGTQERRARSGQDLSVSAREHAITQVPIARLALL